MVRPTMSYDEARQRMRGYYRDLGMLAELGESYGGGPFKPCVVQISEVTSRTERDAARIVDLKERVLQVEIGLKRLTAQQQKFCELEYGLDWPWIRIGPVIGERRQSLHLYEKIVLLRLMDLWGYSLECVSHHG